MSKSNDNWKRLVAAVLRREKDKELAMCESMDSIQSSTCNLSCCSSPIHESSDSLIFNDQQTLRYHYLESVTGKRCSVLGARDLQICWGESSQYWDWTSHIHSRFPEVAKLKHVWWLDIRGIVKISTLSPETSYAAFLVFKLDEMYGGFKSANAIIRYVDSAEPDKDVEENSLTVHLHEVGDRQGEIAIRRSDGWMEVEIGKFYTEEGDHREVHAQLQEINRWPKEGLVVEGIEFRPSCTHETPLASEITPDLCTTDSHERHYLDKMTGRKCVMLGTRELQIAWGNSPEYWRWTSHADSRFIEVAKLDNVWCLDIRGRIKTEKLSRDTTYGVYIVFKLEKSNYGLRPANGIIRYFENVQSDRIAEEKSLVVHFQQVKRRSDGWMEVEIGTFDIGKKNHGELHAQLLETSNCQKGGLIIEGFEFRPAYTESQLVSVSKQNTIVSVEVEENCPPLRMVNQLNGHDMHFNNKIIQAATMMHINNNEIMCIANLLAKGGFHYPSTSRVVLKEIPDKVTTLSEQDKDCVNSDSVDSIGTNGSQDEESTTNSLALNDQLELIPALPIPNNDADETTVLTYVALRVSGLRGFNFIGRGELNPYVAFETWNQKVRTCVAIKTSDPDWNEELAFLVPNNNNVIYMIVRSKSMSGWDDEVLGGAEFSIREIKEISMKKFENLPNGTIITTVEPSLSNCLVQESSIVWRDGKVVQDMRFKLRNVESGEVELQLKCTTLTLN